MDAPSAFFERHLEHLAPGTALDVAAGRGRHCVPLARRGFDVLAVDVSDVAVALLRHVAEEEALPLRAERRDLSESGLPPGRFDLVTCTRFLDRRLFGALSLAVADGGHLLFETFTTLHAERHGMRREYCLEPGELSAAFPDLRIVDLQDAWTDRGHESALLAVRPADGPTLNRRAAP